MQSAAIICPFVLFPQVIESTPLALLPASSKWAKSLYTREIYAVAAEILTASRSAVRLPTLGDAPRWW